MKVLVKGDNHKTFRFGFISMSIPFEVTRLIDKGKIRDTDEVFYLNIIYMGSLITLSYESKRFSGQEKPLFTISNQSEKECVKAAIEFLKENLLKEKY